MSAKRAVRCAVYTRKSTEEGLEQDFNSLDAQRESCESYILSQKAEGWTALKDRYNDGGYSGGTLERPALKRLLKSIEDGLIDVVVVYKIDRLSRSLMDFAKLVEVFDRKGVTFVSVTQSFNTTTSMGRLTLNILLSFAQFEREVTGERIRDKFAASKKKGIWMGGNPPLGYDVQNRKLVVNEAEAETVRFIFERYLELGCVRLLAEDLNAKRIRSKERTFPDGRRVGGMPMGRSSLYLLLANRTYLGETHHKGSYYRGEHHAIVPKTLFEAVRERLAEQGSAPRNGHSWQDAPFAGLLFDETGVAMVPTYVLKRGNVRYRYYVSRAANRGDRSKAGIHRLPAPPFEAFMASVASRLGVAPVPSGSTGEVAGHANDGYRTIIKRIEVEANAIVTRLDREATLAMVQARAANTDGLRADNDLLADLSSRLATGESLMEDGDKLILTLPVRASFRGGRSSVHYPTAPTDFAPAPDATLIKAVARAWQWRQLLNDGTVASIEELARRLGLERGYTGQLLRLAYLSPDLIRKIVQGHWNPKLKLSMLLGVQFPHQWQRQAPFFERLAADARD